MSTYTDIHNRRKENLTILRLPGNENDGLTPQRVIFANPENIYEGTFVGKIDATSVSLSDTTLTNCTIKGGVIQDATICADGQIVKVTELTTQISEISTQAFETLPGIINDVSGILNTYCNNISGNLSTLSSEVKTSVDNLICSDLYILEKIDKNKDTSLSTLSSISSQIENEISEICVGLSTQISSNNIKISTLESRINEISDFSKGGLQFIGNAEVLTNKPNLSNIVFDQRGKSPASNVDVSAGYMYQIKFDNPSTITEIIDGIRLDKDDIIIMKNTKNTSSLISDDICKFDAMDKDVVKKNELCEISIQLSTYTTNASAYSLEQSKLYTNEVSGNLSTDYVDKITTVRENLSTYARETSAASFEASKTYTNGVSTDLSTDYVAKINALEATAATSAATAEANAKAYTNEVSTTLSIDYKKKIDDLSSQLSVNTEKGVKYFGSFIDYTQPTLRGFLYNNISVMIHPSDIDKYEFNIGDQFRFNEKIKLNDKHFGENDYILFNKKVILNSVNLNDIDVIRDANQEGIQVSVDINYLSGEISTLRNDLCSISTNICLSIGGISTIVDDLSSNLSNEISTLRNNLCSVSSNICLSIGGISTIVDGLSSNLSGEISTLRSNLYSISTDICLSVSRISTYINNLSSNYTLVKDSNNKNSRISSITKLTQTNGKISIEARNLSVNDIEDYLESQNEISNKILSEARNQLCVVIKNNSDISVIKDSDPSSPKHLTLKIKDNSILESYLSNGIVSTEKIKNDAITLDKLSSDVIDKIEKTCDLKISVITSDISCIDLKNVNTSPISAIYHLTQTNGKNQAETRLLSTLDIVNFNEKVNEKIFPISSDISTSLKYVGHLTVKQDDNGRYLSALLKTASLWCDKQIVKSGYMINVKSEITGNLSSNSISTADGFKLGNRDFIIIHDHEHYEIPLSNVCSSNVTIIDSQDDNLVYKYDLSSISSTLTNDLCTISSQICLSVSEISSIVDNLSSNLSGEISTLRNNLCSVSTDICISVSGISSIVDGLSAGLSNSISTKIFIQNDISGNLCASYSTLSILKVSRENWETSVLLCSDAELSNILFDISSDYMDAYGQEIKNLAFPTEISSAATKGYVDNLSVQLSNTISGLSDIILEQYFKLSGNNDICGINTYHEIQKFDSISSTALSTNFNQLYDLVPHTLSSIVELSDTFESMYNAIENIKSECQLTEIDFDVSYPIISAFNAINNIAKSSKISVDDISIDLSTGNVNDGFNALSTIITTSNYKYYSNLRQELSNIDSRFDDDEKGIASLTYQLSCLSVKYIDLSSKYDDLKTNSTNQINYLSSCISEIYAAITISSFMSGSVPVKLSYLSADDALSVGC